MHLATHLLLSWTAANLKPLEKRDRGLVTLAGIIPDADALGIIADLFYRSNQPAFIWYEEFHHALFHNVAFATMIAISTLALAKRRLLALGLVMISFHLHLLGDLAGSRGPDGYQWPVPYLFPFSDAWQLTWSGQWQLNAWPNIVLTLILFAWMLYLAWKHGYSPLELLSSAADKNFVATLRNRFGQPKP